MQRDARPLTRSQNNAARESADQSEPLCSFAPTSLHELQSSGVSISVDTAEVLSVLGKRNHLFMYGSERGHSVVLDGVSLVSCDDLGSSATLSVLLEHARQTPNFNATVPFQCGARYRLSPTQRDVVYFLSTPLATARIETRRISAQALEHFNGNGHAAKKRKHMHHPLETAAVLPAGKLAPLHIVCAASHTGKTTVSVAAALRLLINNWDECVVDRLQELKLEMRTHPPSGICSMSVAEAARLDGSLDTCAGHVSRLAIFFAPASRLDAWVRTAQDLLESWPTSEIERPTRRSSIGFVPPMSTLIRTVRIWKGRDSAHSVQRASSATPTLWFLSLEDRKTALAELKISASKPIGCVVYDERRGVGDPIVACKRGLSMYESSAVLGFTLIVTADLASLDTSTLPWHPLRQALSSSAPDRYGVETAQLSRLPMLINPPAAGAVVRYGQRIKDAHACIEANARLTLLALPAFLQDRLLREATDRLRPAVIIHPHSSIAECVVPVCLPRFLQNALRIPPLSHTAELVHRICKSLTQPGVAPVAVSDVAPVVVSDDEASDNEEEHLPSESADGAYIYRADSDALIGALDDLEQLAAHARGGSRVQVASLAQMRDRLHEVSAGTAECCVCFSHSQLLLTSCNHICCAGCFHKLAHHPLAPSGAKACPICRASISRRIGADQLVEVTGASPVPSEPLSFEARLAQVPRAASVRGVSRELHDIARVLNCVVAHNEAHSDNHRARLLVFLRAHHDTELSTLIERFCAVVHTHLQGFNVKSMQQPADGVVGVGFAKADVLFFGAEGVARVAQLNQSTETDAIVVAGAPQTSPLAPAPQRELLEHLIVSSLHTVEPHRGQPLQVIVLAASQ